jgi:hypothetical protein
VGPIGVCHIPVQPMKLLSHEFPHQQSANEHAALSQLRPRQPINGDATLHVETCPEHDWSVWKQDKTCITLNSLLFYSMTVATVWLFQLILFFYHLCGADGRMIH